MLNPLSLLTAQARYGEIHNGVWGHEAKWCRNVAIPEDIGGSWINTLTRTYVSHIYCNIDMEPKLLSALKNIRDASLLDELKSFDGCFMIRDVRSDPGKLSCHSYGLAIDINASENQMGTEGKLTPDFIKCWIKAGFMWGGNFKRRDPMHFTLGW